MRNYVFRRLGQSFLVLWLTYTISFVILYAIPGDPVAIMLGAGGGSLSTATPQQVAQLRHEYGFDHPVVVQYLDRLRHALEGDLGTSIVTGAPVVDVIRDAAIPTIQLTLCGALLAVVFGVGLALLSTHPSLGRVSQWFRSVPAVLVSVPTFWVGLILLELFSFRWRLLPAFGDSGWRTLVLPAITIALPAVGIIAQVLSKSLHSTLEQPFVTMLRARGLSENRILVHHALHNAAVPALSVIGVVGATLLAGTAVVETVFSRNGLGQIAVASVTAKDIPVVQGVVLFAATAFVLTSLAVDLLSPLLDRRITLVDRSSQSSAS